MACNCANLHASTHTAHVRDTNCVMQRHTNMHTQYTVRTADRAQAHVTGAQESLMLDPHGFVATCNSTNFFIVRDGIKSCYCFASCTRIPMCPTRPPLLVARPLLSMHHSGYHLLLLAITQVRDGEVWAPTGVLPCVKTARVCPVSTLACSRARARVCVYVCVLAWLHATWIN